MDTPSESSPDGLHHADSDRWMARTADVVSLAYRADANYLEYGHPNFSSPLQMSTLRSTYKRSRGGHVLVPAHRFREATVVYAGAWSRVRSPDDERMAAEFTTGATSGLVGDSTAPSPDPATFTKAPPFAHGCAVVSDSGYNIHHFLWEHLPAIHLYRDVISTRGRLLVGMSDLSSNSFAQPLLTLMGIDVEVVPMPLHSIVPLHDTILIGTFPFRVYPVDLVRRLTSKIAGVVNGSALSGPQVVFLGRGDHERNRRVLTNEDAVLEEIARRWPDTQTLRPALTPIEETISTLRNCRVLIGPTGGALAHHLWSRRLEHVIEIVPVEYPGTTETEEAARLLGFGYHRIPAGRAGSNADALWVQTDTTCDLEALARLIGSADLGAD